MSKTYIPVAVRRHVIERAFHRCEYCLLPEDYSYYSFHIDHIIPEKQGGTTEASNLALSCRTCNLSKGDSIAAYRTDWGELTRLYHPRQDVWSEHFSIKTDGMILWKSNVGVATIRLLRMNTSERLMRRKLLVQRGIYSS